MLGDGQSLDLFNLLSAATTRGGYEAVSRNGLWACVAEECGLDLAAGSDLRLVFFEYLETLGNLLRKGIEQKDLKFNLSTSCRNVIGVQTEIKRLFSEIPNQKKREEMPTHLEFSCVSRFSDGNEVDSPTTKTNGDKYNVSDKEMIDSDCDTSVLKSSDFRGFSQDNDQSLSTVSDGNINVVNSMDDEVKSRTATLDRYGNLEDDGYDGSGEMTLDSDNAMEQSLSRKRKRGSVLGLVNWVREIAKCPCDPLIGLIPETSKWKSCGNEEIWKQALLFRKLMFLKRYPDSTSEQSSWQKLQKMHPSMYDDHLASGYNLRQRFRTGSSVLPGKEASKSLGSSSSSFRRDAEKCPSNTSGSEDHAEIESLGIAESSSADSLDKSPRKVVHLGSAYQAEVPEWDRMALESEAKWLGKKVWPLEKPNNRFLVERDPIGRGRQESCGCEVPGSNACVRFHVAEKRFKVKLELGGAFNEFRFHKMGEEVALSWSEKEEKKFKNVVLSHPPSLGESFWCHLSEAFPNKSKGELVSYYFNVFLLRYRGYQNRITPTKIDSDDDDDLDSGFAKD